MGILETLFKRNYTNISSDQLKEMVLEKDKYQFVDVRTKQEYKHKHAKGFNINLDFYKFTRNVSMLERLDKNKPVVLICQTGSRSRTTCGILHKLGYNDIYNVVGGMHYYKGPITKK